MLDHLPERDRPMTVNPDPRRLGLKDTDHGRARAARAARRRARSDLARRRRLAARGTAGHADADPPRDHRPAQAKTLCSTNPCESMIEIVRHTQRNVKRWQDGDMCLRWTAAGMLEAEQQFRQIIGYRDLAKLVIAIERHADRVKAATAPLSPTLGVRSRYCLTVNHTSRPPPKLHERFGHPRARWSPGTSPRRSVLHESSRETSDGERPSCRRCAAPTPRERDPTRSPGALRRSRHRPLRSRPRRGGLRARRGSAGGPHRIGLTLSAAALMNSPRWIAAQNSCVTSGRIGSLNTTIDAPILEMEGASWKAPRTRYSGSRDGCPSRLHRTVRTLFVYGCSGRRVAIPPPAGLRPRSHPHSASCGETGAAMCWCARRCRPTTTQARA